jgi:hypothetical protein
LLNVDYGRPIDLLVSVLSPTVATVGYILVALAVTSAVISLLLYRFRATGALFRLHHFLVSVTLFGLAVYLISSQFVG